MQRHSEQSKNSRSNDRRDAIVAASPLNIHEMMARSQTENRIRRHIKLHRDRAKEREGDKKKNKKRTVQSNTTHKNKRTKRINTHVYAFEAIVVVA